MTTGLNVLVTGAGGFLGRHVVDALLARGHRVRAMARPASRVGFPEGVEVVRADLRVSRDLASAFDGVDVLVHLAAAVTGDEDAQFAAGVVGTERLFAAMDHSETRRVVLASSFSVYDWGRVRGTLDENSPVETGTRLYDRDGYAVAKVWQERVARRETARLGRELVVLRPGFIWGEGHADLACLGQRVGPFHLVFGPGGRIPLTYVENCAECFALAADSPAAAGDTFNVVDSDDVTIGPYLGDYLRRSGRRGLRVPIPYLAALAATKASQAGSRLIFRGKGKLPSLLVPRRFEARFKPLRFPNRKAREVLGWAPGVSYREALERTHGGGPSPSNFSRPPSPVATPQ